MRQAVGSSLLAQARRAGLRPASWMIWWRTSMGMYFHFRLLHGSLVVSPPGSPRACSDPLRPAPLREHQRLREFPLG